MVTRCGSVKIGMGALVALVAFASAGDEEAKREKVVVLEARTVRIVDRDGRRRIELTTEVNTEPVLWLYDGRGTRRIRIATTPGGAPLIGLFDKSGKPRASLSMDADGSPELEYCDGAAMPRMTLGLEATGARLAFSNDQGGVTWEVPAGGERR